MTKPFSIYRSSAGSGKTRTLAKEYLTLALRSRADYFKHILAVTFTNKSTQEMKNRILAYLNDFSNDKEKDLAHELQQELGLDASTFKLQVQEVRSEILHKYSQFSISTIDAFFQRVIRAFTREAGLAGDYRLEVEHEEVIDEVISNLIEELGTNKELTDWVVEFAKNNLEEDTSWDVRPGLQKFAKEIFKEEFKLIEDDIAETTVNPGFFDDFRKELNALRNSFIKEIKKRAQTAVAIIQKAGLTSDDFKYAHGGGYGFMSKISGIKSVDDVVEKEFGKRPYNEYQSISNWPSSKTKNSTLIKSLAQEQLIPLLNEIIEIRKNYSAANSAEIVLSNFYAFGLIADISRKLREYKQENNMMLLSDAPYFLNSVIGESDTPFVYEKVGSFYRNFLIDEFQDTSGLQWQNFKPLIINNLDSAHRSIIVGDVKQAIYRWRSGDLYLLQKHVSEQIGEHRFEPFTLGKNFRSSKQIVSFNNNVFKIAAQLVSNELENNVATEVYKDVSQESNKTSEGFVQISFLKGEEEENWDEIALQKVPEHLEKLQALGIGLKDIAILVRKNEDGERIVSHLLEYKHSGKANEVYKYDVVSNESLKLEGAGSINFLIGALQYLQSPDNDIARARLSFEYARAMKATTDLHQVFTVTNQTTFESNLPESFTRQKSGLKKLPLFELTETLIDLFGLGKVSGELEYLQTFQNEVLTFSNRERNDIGTFLEWWEETGKKKSIQISGEVDAAQIITVHKSKGLQFKYVIIPFCSWKLDHEQRPMMWVKSEKPPFEKAGFLPVNYSSQLKESFFADFYKEECTRAYLDNLNLLYVALTRAEHGLIVTAPYKKKNDKLGTVGNLLHNVVQDPEFALGWNGEEKIWKAGEWSKHEQPREDPVPPLTLEQYAANTWRNKLVIRQNAVGYFKEQESDTTTRIKYGIHLHTIFSRIRYRDELDNTFTALQHAGIINEQEKPVIRELVDELLNNQTIASWFDKSWEVRTEVPILLPGGEESRIDRLMTSGQQAVVVDFKTGNPAKSDLQQVNGYLETLGKMNFTDRKGYLLYVKTGEVVQVAQGKSTQTTKQSKNQLGLDF
ncbi:MAG TPA: UvrD-helicase domain-containing protein [Cyclobacteriaceae bacterium]|nr:UvrD-helicase domain-containing protein [Cyclobacteriaceae bacterium]